MSDSVLLIVFGVFVLYFSLFGKTYSTGMTRHRDKPRYPVTRRLRIAMFPVGLISIVLGITRLLRK
jgi:hypothetical protein